MQTPRRSARRSIPASIGAIALLLAWTWSALAGAAPARAASPDALLPDLQGAGFACVAEGDRTQCTRDSGPWEGMTFGVVGPAASPGTGGGGAYSFGTAYTAEFGAFARQVVDAVCAPALALYDDALREILGQPAPADGERIEAARSTPDGACALTVRRAGRAVDLGLQDGLTFSVQGTSGTGPAATPAGASGTAAELQALLEGAGFTCVEDASGSTCSREDGAGESMGVYVPAPAVTFPLGEAVSASFATAYTGEFEAFARDLVELTCAPALALYADAIEEALAQPAPASAERSTPECILTIGTGALETDRGTQSQVSVTIVRIAELPPTAPGASGTPGMGAAAEAFVAGLQADGFVCTFDPGTICDDPNAEPNTWTIFTLSGADSPYPVGTAVAGTPETPYTPAFADRTRELVAVVCEPALAILDATVADALAQPVPAAVERRTPECLLEVDASDFTETTLIHQVEITISRVPAPAPSPDPSASAPGGGSENPSPGPDASEAPIPPGAADSLPDVPGDARPAFAASVAGPTEISTDPATLAISAILAVLVILLIPFPAALFNSTLEANYDEVRGWFRLPGRTPPAAAETAATVAAAEPPETRQPRLWERGIGVALFLVLSAVLFGFLDPEFGASAATPAMFLGTLAGLVLVTGVAALLPVIAHARAGDRGRFRALPLTLLVGVACVAISRATGFLPGYLYGLIVALEFARAFDERSEGRTAALAAAFLLGVSAVAWLLLAGLRAVAGAEPGLGFSILETALASLVVAGVEGVVFGAVPLRFLPGATIFRWSRPAWAAIYGLGVFAFLHILLNPESGYLISTERTPLLTSVGLLVGFGIVSVAFWGWFRWRPAPAAA